MALPCLSLASNTFMSIGRYSAKEQMRKALLDILPKVKSGNKKIDRSSLGNGLIWKESTGNGRTQTPIAEVLA